LSRSTLGNWEKIEKTPVLEWDSDDLGHLFLAFLDHHGIDSQELERSVCNEMAEGEVFYEAWSKCVDWDRFNAEVEERQAQKLEELREEEPDHPLVLEHHADYGTPQPPRCPLTLELPLEISL
jgi:hypothetical protein